MGAKTYLKKFLIFIVIMSMLLSMSGCNENSDNREEELQQTEKEHHELDKIVNALLQFNPQPMPGDSGGDWVILGLARWGEEGPENWFDAYYKEIENYVKNCEGILHEKKYTEYSRTILVLTAMGKDPTNVAGYNLLEPLADFEQTVFQGMNGPVFALLALDSGRYEIPKNKYGTTQATREMYVDYILSKEASEGGWSLAGGAAEIDITAMVLQALAKYNGREDVAAAIERGLMMLSAQQNELGGYLSYDVESSETIAQVITALCELGISIEDERFVKNGRTLVDRLYDFATEAGGFRHILEGEIDPIATEQAFYCLVSLNRVESGSLSLYNMTDVKQ